MTLSFRCIIPIKSTCYGPCKSTDFYQEWLEGAWFSNGMIGDYWEIQKLRNIFGKLGETEKAKQR